MNQKVSIIYPPNNAELFSISPPLGALYLTSYLREKGINVETFDLNITKNWKRKINTIIDDEPNIIALSSNVANYSNTIYISKLIKESNSNIKTVVGGPYPSCIPKKYLQYKSIDYVCVGEGERTLYEFIQKGNHVVGLMSKQNGKIQYLGARKLIEDINELPFPALDQVNLKKYNYIFQKKKPLSNLISSRGCPYNCTFCFHGVHGFKWRARSPKNVMAEIKWQVYELGVKELCIWDDNFTFDLKRVEEICSLIKKENLDFVWQCPNGLRVDRVTKKLLNTMKNSGCYSVVLSETGDSYIIDKIQKGFTIEETEKVFKWCKELNIFAPIYFMMGFPFETLTHVKNTMNFIKRVKPDLISIHKFYPFPNTPIVDENNLTSYEDRGYQTAKISKDFDKMYKNIYLKFYLNPRTLKEIFIKMGMKYLLNSAYRYITRNLKEIIQQKFKSNTSKNK